MEGVRVLATKISTPSPFGVEGVKLTAVGSAARLGSR